MGERHMNIELVRKDGVIVPADITLAPARTPLGVSVMATIKPRNP
jgi:hypothetical protein